MPRRDRVSSGPYHLVLNTRCRRRPTNHLDVGILATSVDRDVAPMPQPTGSAITLSPYGRPTHSRALSEAQSRGSSNCLMLDMIELLQNR